ncbi:hypothetical protein O4H49_04350 [Kiloniella laminariae]|uniref:Uncharacterized protein n=1 Tax=Kiloniella laminariae TaxID=454162 RepID=A0ABT4LFW4_9PROT|nr:hypothetical protein [Kiloniella laminariae]MCZ4279996.1 hypothetical protein [Kiloniella laminariae]
MKLAIIIITLAFLSFSSLPVKANERNATGLALTFEQEQRFTTAISDLHDNPTGSIELESKIRSGIFLAHFPVVTDALTTLAELLKTPGKTVLYHSCISDFILFKSRDRITNSEPQVVLPRLVQVEICGCVAESVWEHYSQEQQELFTLISNGTPLEDNNIEYLLTGHNLFQPQLNQHVRYCTALTKAS